LNNYQVIMPSCKLETLVPMLIPINMQLKLP